MKNLIVAATLVVSAIVAAPATAGEAYVRNTDSYSRETTRTRVQFSGKEVYNGVETSYASAYKYRSEKDFGRGSYDYSYQTASSATSDIKLYGGYNAYRGIETGYGVTTEYSHEVAGGVR